jgi:outer membrane protein OmpA-like peptidoglycan-associated protein
MRRWHRVVLSAALLLAGCASKAPPPKFVHFDVGADRPRSEDDTVQIGLAVSALQHEPRLKAAVIGYASSEGTEAENKKLSFRRAEHVRDLIVRNGIAVDRLTIAARGIADPAGPNDTEEGRAKNRRVEVFFYDPGRGELQAQYGVKIEVQAH